MTDKFEVGKKYWFAPYKDVHYTCVYSDNGLVTLTYINTADVLDGFTTRVTKDILDRYTEVVEPKVYVDTYHMYYYMYQSEIYALDPFMFDTSNAEEYSGAYEYISQLTYKTVDGKLFINDVEIPLIDGRDKHD